MIRTLYFGRFWQRLNPWLHANFRDFRVHWFPLNRPLKYPTLQDFDKRGNRKTMLWFNTYTYALNVDWNRLLHCKYDSLDHQFTKYREEHGWKKLRFVLDRFSKMAASEIYFKWAFPSNGHLKKKLIFFNSDFTSTLKRILLTFHGNWFESTTCCGFFSNEA